MRVSRWLARELGDGNLINISPIKGCFWGPFRAKAGQVDDL